MSLHILVSGMLTYAMSVTVSENSVALCIRHFEKANFVKSVFKLLDIYQSLNYCTKSEFYKHVSFVYS